MFIFLINHPDFSLQKMTVNPLCSSNTSFPKISLAQWALSKAKGVCAVNWRLNTLNSLRPTDLFTALCLHIRFLMVNNAQCILSSGNCTHTVWVRKDDTQVLDSSLLALSWRHNRSQPSIPHRAPATLRGDSLTRAVYKHVSTPWAEGETLPLEQADVGEEGLSVLIEDVQGVAQHLLAAALAQDVLWHRHLRPEVEGHGRLPQGRCVGSPGTGTTSWAQQGPTAQRWTWSWWMFCHIPAKPRSSNALLCTTASSRRVWQLSRGTSALQCPHSFRGHKRCSGTACEAHHSAARFSFPTRPRGK